MKMNTLPEIIENLKNLIHNLQLNPRDKVFDKDVALLLRIPQTTFATMKKRNSVPYEEIMEFCLRNAIRMEEVFYGRIKLGVCEGVV